MGRIKEFILNRMYLGELRQEGFTYSGLYSLAVFIAFGSVKKLKASDPKKLRGFKHTVYEMHERKQFSFFLVDKLLRRDITSGTFSVDDKLVFFQNLKEFVDMGKNEIECLEFISNLNFISPKLRYIISNMYKEVTESHKDFLEVLQTNDTLLGEAYINFYSKTVEGGELSQALDSIIEELKFKRDLYTSLSREELSFKFNVFFTHVINLFLLGYVDKLLFESFTESMTSGFIMQLLVFIADLFTNFLFIGLSILGLVILLFILPNISQNTVISDVVNMKVVKLREPYKYFYNTSFFIALELFIRYTDSTEAIVIGNALGSVDNFYYRYIMTRKLEDVDLFEENIFGSFFSGLKLIENKVLYRLENSDGLDISSKVTEIKEYYLSRRNYILEDIPKAYAAMNQIFMVVNTVIVMAANMVVTLRLNDLSSTF